MGYHLFTDFICKDKMLLENLKIIGSEGQTSNIEIENGIIKNIYNGDNKSPSRHNDLSFKFDNAIAFPGLINSPDHLEFSTFPKLGDRIYKDYIEWGNDIHSRDDDFINKVRSIPYGLRFKFGLYRNLLCGVTTVVHHGNGAIFNFKDLPDVHSGYNYLHSVGLENKWRLKLNILFNGLPFLIHTGEGTNQESADEVTQLLRWNIFRKQLIGIHAISVTENQAKKFRAIIWCPDSNLFLYNKTADISSFKKHTNILFGTDSNVSSDWNMWNHLRLARRLNQLYDDELFGSISETAAGVWKMRNKGTIEVNKTADLVIAARKYEKDWDSFYAINPEAILLILKNGTIVLADKKVFDKNPGINENYFDTIKINSSIKLVIKGLSELLNQIRSYLPDYKFPIEIEN